MANGSCDANVRKQDWVVDCLDLVAQLAAEERAELDRETVLPKSAWKQMRGYLSVSKA